MALSLEQIEADIRLCEAYLARDRVVHTSSEERNIAREEKKQLIERHEAEPRTAIAAHEQKRPTERHEPVAQPATHPRQKRIPDRQTPAASSAHPEEQKRPPEPIESPPELTHQQKRPPERQEVQPAQPAPARERPKSARPLSARRIDSLYKEANERVAVREEKKRQLEQQELDNCTFKPTVNNPDKFLNVRSQLPVEERLHHEADHRIAIRERAKRELEERELNICTFRPSVNDAQKFLNLSTHRPLYERVGELQRKKVEKLQRMRIEKEQDPGLTFSPAINPTSRTVASTTMRSLDSSSFHMTHSTQLLESLAEPYTFQPVLSSNSEKIIEDSELFAGPNRDFLQRQKAFERRAKRNEQVLKERNAQEVNASMMPAAKRLDTSMSIDSVQRLTRDKERMDAQKAAIANEYYEQFTFKPKINPISKAIGRPSSVDQLVNNERMELAREQARAAAAEMEREQCTFRPQLTRASAAGTPSKFADPGVMLQKMEEYKKLRDLKMEQARQSMEYESLKGCTFNPEINRSQVKASQGPIVVRGMGRYLELKELARRQLEEKKDREQRVFFVHPTGNPVQHTQPQPFELHADAGAQQRRIQALQAAKQREMQECTFKPVTNESNNRELLGRILSDSSLM
eukprot:TRINITY_DN12591_c0_g1_i1.p1 TRINITY_DN12591_c0_g1~~TRINITY_DN12591_c0_g1_i1.p1  ORF type:complete len:634 (+),score=152.18 TRINITY_DN12591_c0_g1_i1:129-2030(+)